MEWMQVPRILMAGQPDGLDVALLAVGILLAFAVVAAAIAQIVVMVGYWKGNRTQNSLGLTGGDCARRLLDRNGMPEVQVKKCTLLRTLLFGNHYSVWRKTVYLRILTIEKTSVTSLAMAAQKAALAEQHHKGDRAMIFRSRMQGLGVFAPILFLPLVILGLLLDVLVLESLVLFPITLVLGLLFILLGFVATLLNIPVEKKAMARAEEWLSESLTPQEVAMIHTIYRSYMVEYVLQFVIALLRMIQLILKVMRAAKKK